MYVVKKATDMKPNHRLNFQTNMESMKPNQMCIYTYAWQLGHSRTASNVHNSIMYNRKSHMLESCLTWITFWSDFWSHFYLLLFAGTFSSSLFLHFRVHYSLQLRCRVHFPTQRFHIFVYVLTDSCIFRHIFLTFLRGKQRRGGRASPAQARHAPQAPQPQASPGPQDPPGPRGPPGRPGRPRPLVWH